MSLLVNNISLDLPLAILLSSRESLPEMDVTEKKVGAKMEGIGPYDSMWGPGASHAWTQTPAFGSQLCE